MPDGTKEAACASGEPAKQARLQVNPITPSCYGRLPVPLALSPFASGL